MAVASVFAGRFVDAAHRQGIDAETAIAGPRVGLLRLLTKAAAVVRSPAAGHATLQSAADGRCDIPGTEAPMGRWDRGRRPPESPVAAFISFG